MIMAVSTIENHYTYKMISGYAPLTIPIGWNEATIQCVVGNNDRCFSVDIVKEGMTVDSVYTHRNGYYINTGNYGAVFLTTQLKANGSCNIDLSTANIGGTDYASTTWIKIMYR